MMRRGAIGLGVLAMGLAALAVTPGVPSAGLSTAPDLPLRINAGGDQVTDSEGNQWQADQAYTGDEGWGYVNTDRGGRVDHGQDIAGTQDDAIFSTERWGMDAYRVDVADGTYDVQLLFAETYDMITESGQRVFDVAIQDSTALEGLDVYAEAGFATALVKEVQGVEVLDGQLEIAFTPRVEQPMIKGIVISAAEDQATPASPTPTPTPEPTPTPHDADAGVVDVPIRLNAGGEAFEDRQGNHWLADQAYAVESGWGYRTASDAGVAPYRHEYHGGVGFEPHASGREGMSSYRFHLPDQGPYQVTLDFTGRLEDLQGFGERVFYVTVGETVPGEQEASVIGPIDPWTAFHTEGVPNRYTVEYVRPVNGVLDITFTPVIGTAAINGIVIEGQN